MSALDDVRSALGLIELAAAAHRAGNATTLEELMRLAASALWSAEDALIVGGRGRD